MHLTKWTLLGACASLVALVALGDAQATGGRPVKFQGADRELSGTLFEPSGAGPFPAVVEIHGINGQAEWDFETGRRLAAEGYVTLAVDLFGRRSRDYGDGLRQRDRFRPRVADDLRGAVSYLTSLKNVLPDRIGALGWCMGGGYALLLAVAEPTLAASVVYYGPVTPPPGPSIDDLAKIRAPVIGFFGQEDTSIPLTSIKMWANNMRDAGKHLELHIYPDAGHGFAERSSVPATHGEHHAADPAADSWQKTLTFLKTHLAKSK